MSKTRSWFTIDGALEPIDYEGENDFRFPLELAARVLEEFCPPGGWVLDPFAGFGTTLVAAQQQGKHGVGFEVDPRRHAFAARRVSPPSRVVHDRAENVADHELPEFDLVFTSPPYASFTGEANDPMEVYLAGFEEIFSRVIPTLKPGGHLVLEVSTVNDDRGVVPLAWHCGLALSRHLDFLGERIRCNTGGAPAGPGFDHSYLLVFRRPD